MKFISVIFLLASLGTWAMDNENSLRKFAREIELSPTNSKNLFQAVDLIFAEDKYVFVQLLENLNDPGVAQQIIDLTEQRVIDRISSDSMAMLSLGPALGCIKAVINIYLEQSLSNLARIKRTKYL